VNSVLIFSILILNFWAGLQDFIEYEVDLITFILLFLFCQTHFWLNAYEGMIFNYFSIIAIILLFYFIIKFVGLEKQYGLGDYFFLLSIAPLFSVRDFLLVTISSHILGILYIIIIKTVKKSKLLETASPQIFFYSLVSSFLI